MPSTSDAVSSELIQWFFDRDDPAHHNLAVLAGPVSKEATRWLYKYVPVLADAAGSYDHGSGPRSLLHLDVRSDNLRIVDGRLKLFDWPHVASGGPEFDCVVFAPTVELENGPSAEIVLDWYCTRLPLSSERVTGAVALISGFFAFHAWQPEIDGLPRLRPFQAAQFRVSLKWTARRLGLPEPNWVDQVGV